MDLDGLIDLLVGLFRDDDVRAALAEDPQGLLRGRGLGEVTGQDLAAAVPAACGRLGPEEAQLLSDRYAACADPTGDLLSVVTQLQVCVDDEDPVFEDVRAPAAPPAPSYPAPEDAPPLEPPGSYPPVDHPDADVPPPPSALPPPPDVQAVLVDSVRGQIDVADRRRRLRRRSSVTRAIRRASTPLLPNLDPTGARRGPT
jgi:hypothetical protein